jgi:hypothetical protein
MSRKIRSVSASLWIAPSDRVQISDKVNNRTELYFDQVSNGKRISVPLSNSCGANELSVCNPETDIHFEPKSRRLGRPSDRGSNTQRYAFWNYATKEGPSAHRKLFLSQVLPSSQGLPLVIFGKIGALAQPLIGGIEPGVGRGSRQDRYTRTMAGITHNG